MKPGISVLLDDGCTALRGLRVGAILNPTSVDPQLRHLADLRPSRPHRRGAGAIHQQ